MGFKPFVEDSLDNYEFISLVSTSLLFFFGALTQGYDSNAYKGFAQVMSAVVMVAFLLYSIGFAVIIFKNVVSAESEDAAEDSTEVPEKDGGVALANLSQREAADI